MTPATDMQKESYERKVWRETRELRLFLEETARWPLLIPGAEFSVEPWPQPPKEPK